MMVRKLYRSSTNKILAGVCGGLGDYLHIDPVMVRILWSIVVLGSGIFPGVVAYIIAAIVIPEDRPIIHEHKP